MWVVFGLPKEGADYICKCWVVVGVRQRGLWGGGLVRLRRGVQIRPPANITKIQGF